MLEGVRVINRKSQYTLGIDIGSTTVKVAILDEDNELLFSDYERHFANIQETLSEGVIKELRRLHPEANIVAIDYDPGASEVNQLNRIKLMLSTAYKRLEE